MISHYRTSEKERQYVILKPNSTLYMVGTNKVKYEKVWGDSLRPPLAIILENDDIAAGVPFYGNVPYLRDSSEALGVYDALYFFNKKDILIQDLKAKQDFSIALYANGTSMGCLSIFENETVEEMERLYDIEIYRTVNRQEVIEIFEKQWDRSPRGAMAQPHWIPTYGGGAILTYAIFMVGDKGRTRQYLNAAHALTVVFLNDYVKEATEIVFE